MIEADYGCKKEQICRQIMDIKAAGKRGPEPLRQSRWQDKRGKRIEWRMLMAGNTPGTTSHKPHATWTLRQAQASGVCVWHFLKLTVLLTLRFLYCNVPNVGGHFEISPLIVSSSAYVVIIIFVLPLEWTDVDGADRSEWRGDDRWHDNLRGDWVASDRGSDGRWNSDT